MSICSGDSYYLNIYLDNLTVVSSERTTDEYSSDGEIHKIHRPHGVKVFTDTREMKEYIKSKRLKKMWNI